MLRIDQAHDYRILRIPGRRAEAGRGSAPPGCGPVTVIGVVGMAAVAGGWTLVHVIPSDPYSGTWMFVLAFAATALLTLAGVFYHLGEQSKRGPSVTVRVGASWLQVADGPRVAFDTVTLLQTDDELVIAGEHTATVPDPDGEVYAELSRALEAWQTRETAGGDGSIAAREQKRLQSLTHRADSER